MSPQLALVAWLLFVIYLFREEFKLAPGASNALWVPVSWMFLAGSRYVSAWLNIGEQVTLLSDLDGSPIDRAAFFALIAAGVAILSRRDIAWGQLLRKNSLLFIYFAYCLLSTSWSDDTFVGFKRWFKDLGNLIMALIILTDPKPAEALGLVLRRLAYLLLPLSVLFVKYYPEFGRAYHHGGVPMYTGAGNQKNALGMMCLVTGIYFFWQILQQRDSFLRWTRAGRLGLYILLCMVIWLLVMSDSATSLTCLLIAVSVFAVGLTPFVRKKPSRIMGLLITTGIVVAILEASFDIRLQIVALLGRNPDLTNRTEIWRLVLGMATDPVFGTGFMSFWDGPGRYVIFALDAGIIKQAHSGYIELYVNLGYIGVALMALLILNGLVSSWQHLSTDTSMAILRLSLILVALFYNYTEASFYGINNIWLLTLVGLIHLPESPALRATLPRVAPTIGNLRNSHHQRSP